MVRANIPEALIHGAANLRAAMRHGAGVDMIPVAAATAAGVLVTNVPGANATTVAEYVMLASLALARRFRMIDGDLRKAGWFAGRSHAEQAGEIAGAPSASSAWAISGALSRRPPTAASACVSSGTRAAMPDFPMT